MKGLEKNVRKGRGISRRRFLESAAGAGLVAIVPRHVLGGVGRTGANDRLNVAAVGIGGRGADLLREIRDAANVVALCDVDEKYAAKTFRRHRRARRYRDFRTMLERQKDIDAVIVATPDHTHAVVTMMALEMGKHVYCEKPLTHTVFEARKIPEAAREAKVATQVGTQGHSSEDARLINQWIWEGAIGPVREVHAWTDRPLKHDNWIEATWRPKEKPRVPPKLDWDLWLGPAPRRPYHPSYLHGTRWRPWFDFGTGALGDLGSHHLDPVYWALGLGQCDSFSVEATSSKVYPETFPKASIVRYRFPARGDMPPVKITWYDGGLMPERPEELKPDEQMPGNGVLFVGDKGKLLCDGWSRNPRLISESGVEARKKAAEEPPSSCPHLQEWVEACKTGRPTSANFEYAGPLTELILLGNVALRAARGLRLEWDRPAMKVANVPEANEYLHMDYRRGWTL